MSTKELKEKIKKRRKLKRKIKFQRFLVSIGLYKDKDRTIEYDSPSQEKLVFIVEKMIRNSESYLSTTIHSENLYIKNETQDKYVIITPKKITLIDSGNVVTELIFELLYKRLSYKFRNKLESERQKLDELITSKIEDIVNDIE
jgi:hypothetical protein